MVEGIDNDVFVFVVVVVVTVVSVAALIQRRNPTTPSTSQLHPGVISDIRTFQAQAANHEWITSSSDQIPPTQPPSSSTNICPICLDQPPSIEILTNCAHSFCAECIIEYWRHKGSPVGLLPCPICRSPVTMLHPATPLVFLELHGPAMHTHIQHFNRTCAARSRSWCEKFHDAPLLLNIVIANPRVLFAEQVGFFVAVSFCAGIYLLSPLDLIPELLFGPLGLIDDAAVGVVAFVFLAELVRRAIVLALVVPPSTSTLPPAAAATTAAVGIRRRTSSRLRVR